MTVKKDFDWPTVAAREEKRWSSGTHLLTSWKHIAISAVLAVGLVVYMEFLFKDISQSVKSPGYPSPHFTAHDDRYFAEDEGTRDPAPSGIPEGKNVNGATTDRGVVPESTNAKTEEDGSLTNSTTSPAPSETTMISVQDVSNEAATQLMDDPSRNNDQTGDQTQAHSVDHDGNQVATSTNTSSGKVSVLVGVMILAHKVKRREMIRQAYQVHSFDGVDFTFRFILGGYQLEPWLESENATNGDLIVLQCKENMNTGKTFTFFSSLPDMGNHYDYVMKTDDDSYTNLANLGKNLKPFPRTDLYYGYSLPCKSDEYPSAFRTGAGYLLSWDLVLWIRDSPIPRNNTIGAEDMLVGEWFQQGDVAKNRPRSYGLFHDRPDAGGPCARNLTMDSILIHKLKTDDQWYKVIDFYNTST